MVGVNRTRSIEAPREYSETPDQVKGSRPGAAAPVGVPAEPEEVASVPREAASAWVAASSTAGCRACRALSWPASAGSATSARTSSPCCQTARRPWKDGP